jgi:hypothetical protein
LLFLLPLTLPFSPAAKRGHADRGSAATRFAVLAFPDFREFAGGKTRSCGSRKCRNAVCCSCFP